MIDNQREHDLVRQMRMELHREDLITDTEYAELASEHGGVQRLEDYDVLRAQVEKLQAERDNVLDASKEGSWMARALDAEREAKALRTALEVCIREIGHVGCVIGTREDEALGRAQYVAMRALADAKEPK